MAPGGEVARQWFIPGEGIDRNVISADLQRYLGNDATVRPGIGTGEYQGVHGFWIKAYRNLTSAMIADLRANSQRWRQEQRQTGSGDQSYYGSRTYNQSNASSASRQAVRRDGNNSPSIDDYTPGMRQGDPRQGRPQDAMQIDSPMGRAGQSAFGPPYDARSGQYQQDPNRPFLPPGRGQTYPDQAVVDTYGQPDAHGRFFVNQYGQERMPQNYRPPQGPPAGYVQQGEYYVPASTGAYQQQGMMPTAAAYPPYDGRQQPLPQRGNPEQPGQSGRGGRDPNYPQPDFDPYPSPATTVPDIYTGRGGAPQQSGYGYQQGQYEAAGRPVSNPAFGQNYAPEADYPPQRDPNPRAQQPPQGSQRETDRRHRRNG